MQGLGNIVSSGERLLSIIATSVYFYGLIVVLIRIMGKRATSQLNSFDWIITVAVGSLVGSGILLKDVSVAAASAAIISLALCQWALTWLTVHNSSIEKVAKAAPTLLVNEGKYLTEPMDHERISKSEMDAAIRKCGFGSIEEVGWVILETNGDLNVLSRGLKHEGKPKLVEEALNRSDPDIRANTTTSL